jgi:formylglycine-generating enzyme required for sulfatase activity
VLSVAVLTALVPMIVQLVGRDTGAKTQTAFSQKDDQREPEPAPANAPFNAEQARAYQEAWAKHLGVPVGYENSIGMKFRLIPPGEFLRGSSAEEIEETLGQIDPTDAHYRACIQSEAPAHRVRLTRPLYLSVHETTQGEYESVMGTNPAWFATAGPNAQHSAKVAGIDTQKFPVEHVSWNGAAQFCERLSRQQSLTSWYVCSEDTVSLADGIGYRLPTEAEWEFACRAGSTMNFSNGDRDEQLANTGWFRRNSGGRTHTVGELEANAFGLHDMHGNVREWCQDSWQSASYAPFETQTASDPCLADFNLPQRVLRGGNYSSSAQLCRSSHRHANSPTPREHFIGFRTALSIEAVRQLLKPSGAQRPQEEIASAPSPLIDFDVERQIAERLLKFKKWKTYLSNGQTEWELTSPLSPDPFHVHDVGCVEADVTDEEIAVLAGCRGLVKLDARNNPQLTAAGLKSVGSLPRLETLILDETACARESLEFLANYPRLKALTISGVGRDGVFQTLPPCRRLTKLDTTYQPGSVGDAGMQAIARQCPNLTELFLNDSQPHTLAPLSQMRSLRQVHCYSDHLNDEAVSVLAELPDFQSLGIERPTPACLQRLDKLGGKLREFAMRNQYGLREDSVTDAVAWQTITRCNQLEQLTIMNLIAIDAASLRAVAALPRLKVFHVYGSITEEERTQLRRYTAADVAEFHQARPDVELHIDGQEFPAAP